MHNNDKKPDRRWNYESCFKEAKKYEYKSIFRTNASGAYSAAFKNKWLKDYTWFKEPSRTRKWTYDVCYKEAQKYSSKKEFREKSNGAYNAAYKHKWLDDYTWFERPDMTRKWTYENCYEEAKKYSSKKEFKKNCSSAYTTAYRNGWMSGYSWLNKRCSENYTYDYFIEVVKRYTTLKDFKNNERKLYNCAKKNKWLNANEYKYKSLSKPKGYWTKEKCLEAALKYKTKTEFRINESGAYSAARKYGWLNEITSHMQTKIVSECNYHHKHIIYVYKDYVNHYVYVGLTNNIKRRHKAHCDENVNDVLYQHFFKYNLEIPEPEIVYNNLTPNEAQDKEKEVFYQYRDAGWNMINAECSLGSLGSQRKWTFNKCYKIAIKYKTKKEFMENDRNAYKIAKKYHYLEEFTWFEHASKIWNYQTTYDEAKKYKTSKDFQSNAPGAYSAASKNRWLKDYTWLNAEPRPNKKRIWTYQTTFDEAKKYETLYDFRTNSPKAYNASLKYNWINEYTWLERNQERLRTKKWDYQTTFDEAKKYDSVKEFRKQSGSAYTTACVNGWIKDYIWLNRLCKENNTWTYEACYEEAKKYEYLKDFRKCSVSAYSASQRHGWLKDFNWLIRKK